MHGCLPSKVCTVPESSNFRSLPCFFGFGTLLREVAPRLRQTIVPLSTYEMPKHEVNVEGVLVFPSVEKSAEFHDEEGAHVADADLVGSWISVQIHSLDGHKERNGECSIDAEKLADMGEVKGIDGRTQGCHGVRQLGRDHASRFF